MKKFQLALLATALVSTGAMANTVTDAAGSLLKGTTKAVTNTGSAIVNGAGTFVKTATKPAAISAEVGTLGYGANIAWGANETTEVVAGWAGGDIAKAINDNFDAKGVNYQLDTRFSNPYLGVQVRPAANWFTIGTGIIIPDNKLEVKANPNSDGTYHIGGEDYSQSDVGVLEGKLEHRNKVAPYLTVGFRPNIDKNWGVFGEVGAAYLGQVDATVTATGASANMSQAQRDELAAQAEKDLEDKNYLKVLPIAKLGVTYRF